MMVKIAVIIPVYNVERYLDDCLLSFLGQSSKQFHIYMIDDGSVDNSAAIAKQYAKKYPELFEYHYQDNKGQGSARNFGVSLVKNEDYIWFFDSDDVTGPKTIENVISVIEKHNPDVVLFTPTIFDTSNNQYFPWYDKELIEYIFKANNITNSHEHPELFSIETSMCRFVSKKELYTEMGVAFPENIKWEDALPRYQLMHKAKSVYFLDIIGAYYYRINTGKQTTQGNSKTRLDMYPAFNQILDLIEKEHWDEKVYPYLIRTIQNYVMWSFKVIDQSLLKEYSQLMHKIYQRIPVTYYKQYRDLTFPFRPRYRYYLLARIIRCWLYRFIHHKHIAAFAIKRFECLVNIRNNLAR